jgi:hypothetical protein
MGMFAETAVVEYRLLLADQEKQTSVFSFRLQQSNGTLPFSFSFCSKQMKVVVFCSCCFIFAEFRKHGDMDMEMWRTCRH